MASAQSILLAQRLFGGGERRENPSPPAKTDAKNNVRIVDKDNEFPHYTEDIRALQ